MMSSFAAIYLVIKIKMNLRKVSIAALFLTASFTTVYAQQDTVKTEKKLEGVTIKGTTKKGAESNLINMQKKSVEVVETVGTEQLSKQGIGDVATAVTKATGTVKQEGSGTISVRGLLDRYNTTTLNNLPIPSENPENKNIDLSILKTDMIEYIAIEKVFAPRLLGDFGGANINVLSKEYRGKPYAKIGIESSVNTQAFDADPFYLQSGPNFWGFKTAKTPGNSRNVYPVNTSWNFKDTFADSNFTPINSGFSLEGGKNFKLGETTLSAFFYGGWNNDYFYAHGKEANYNSTGNRLNDYNVDKYNYGTNTTGVVNLFYRLNSNNRLKLISNYIHSTTQETRIFQGYNYDWATLDNAYIRRAEYKVTDLFVNQLGGEHKLSDKLDLDWIVGYNMLDSKRPDRISNTLIRQPNGIYRVRRDGGSSNRYFDNLNDDELSGNISANYKITDNFKLNLGYQGRFKDRKFDARQFDFRYSPAYSGLGEVVDPNNIDQVFNQQRFDAGYFTIESNKQNPDNYFEIAPIIFNGKQYVNSGFANLDYVWDKLTAQIGVRFDNINQDMNWDTNYTLPDGSKSRKFDYQKFLPSLNLKYSLTDNQNLRLSASRTYTLPQMKELAPYMYNDVSETTVGNPDVKPSDNNNLDLKWEYFPGKGELFSLTGYGKYIQNPISKALVGEGLYSYLNVGDWAYVWGLEAEVRKDLYKTDNGKFYTFLNASYLNSQSELDTEKIKKESTFYVAFDQGVTKDKLEGAADFIGNANLGYSYTSPNKTIMDFVASYSYIGQYVYALSTMEIGNVVQKPINLFDATFKVAFPNKIELSLKGKNLINSSVKRIQKTGQESVTYDYKRGREFGVSLGYTF